MKSTQDNVDALAWIPGGMEAISGLWDQSLSHAWRTSQEKAAVPNAGPAASAKYYFPTATFHALIALGELGALKGLDVGDAGMPWLADAKDRKLELPTANSALDRLMNLVVGTPPVSAAGAAAVSGTASPLPPDDGWFDAVMEASSNKPTDGMLTEVPGTRTRRLVLLGHAAPAFRFLLRDCDDAKVASHAGRLRAGVRKLAESVGECFRDKSGKFLDATAIAEYPFLSPYLVLNAAVVLDEYATIDRLLDGRASPGVGPLPGDLAALREIFRQYFTVQVERLMARRSVRNDPIYDDASLAFAVRGLLVVLPEFREGALFKAAVEAVVAGQLHNGCWPSAVSVAFSTTGDVLQQPSVEVALIVAASVFDPTSVVASDPGRTAAARVALPALRRTLAYLAATHTASSGGSPPGWASDRTRPKNHVEMWVNSLATRLAYHVHRIERVCERERVLHRFPTTAPRKPLRKGLPEEAAALRAQWEERIAEPEVITRPARTVFDKLILPTWNRRWLGDLFVKPPKDGTSFIVYGPPGSGKTYAIKKLAEVLNWPLVSLSPGRFIRHGLEDIEAAAGGVFRRLMRLDHAVVLFDECDELFRDRDSSDASQRNILSFVTASMLPKLQDLHDNRRAVFVLATNYLSRIDKAVRRIGRFDHVLLFDRPGPEARQTQIEKVLAGRKPAVDPATVPVADWVKATAGFVFEDLDRFVSAKLTGAPYTSPEITDYLDWCIEWGRRELDASPLSAPAKSKLLKYWQDLPGYAVRVAEKKRAKKVTSVKGRGKKSSTPSAARRKPAAAKGKSRGTV